MNRIHLPIIAAILAAVLVSCSHGGTSTLSPVEPGLTGDTVQAVYEPNRYLWGYWQIMYDPSDGTFEVVPQHVAADHWNVLKWLEGGPCTNCVKVVGAQGVGTVHPHGAQGLAGASTGGPGRASRGHSGPGDSRSGSRGE